MRNRGQNHKINEIISLSQNYKLHRLNLQSVKASIDNSDAKRSESIQKLKTERLRYRRALRNFNQTEIQRENDRLVKKIGEIAKRPNKKPPSSSQSRNLTQSRQTYRTTNKRLNSSSSSTSLLSVCSNSRQRILKNKEIQRQNKKIASRILNPKKIRQYALEDLKRSYERQQQNVKTRSRFSHKNQQIIKSLALQGLKFDRRDVQYLPQLVHKRSKNTLEPSQTYIKYKKIPQQKSTHKLN